MSDFYDLVLEIWGWFWQRFTDFVDTIFNINVYFTGVLYTILLITVAGFLVDLVFSFMFSVRARRLIFFNPFNPKSLEALKDIKHKDIKSVRSDFRSVKQLNQFINRNPKDLDVKKDTISAINRYPYRPKPFPFPRLTVIPPYYYNRDLKQFVFRSHYDYKTDKHFDSKLDKRSDSQTGGLKGFSLSAGLMTIRYYQVNRFSLTNLYNSLRLSNPYFSLTKSQFLRSHLGSYYSGLKYGSSGGVNRQFTSTVGRGTGADFARGLRNDKIRAEIKKKQEEAKAKNEKVGKTGSKKFTNTSTYDGRDHSNSYSVSYEE